MNQYRSGCFIYILYQRDKNEDFGDVIHYLSEGASFFVFVLRDFGLRFGIAVQKQLALSGEAVLFCQPGLGELPDELVRSDAPVCSVIAPGYPNDIYFLFVPINSIDDTVIGDANSIDIIRAGDLFEVVFLDRERRKLQCQ
jgi:hypothetical protein